MFTAARGLLVLPAFVAALGASRAQQAIAQSPRVAAQKPSSQRWVKSDIRPGVVAAPNLPPVDTLSPYPTLFAYSAVYQGYPQPLGHQIIYTSRNSYAYRPVTDLRGMVTAAIEDLRAGRFEEALVELEPVRSEAADDPFAALLESQAQFGAGRYSQAVDALAAALANLPPDRWGLTVIDYREYFGSQQRYMQRLYALASHTREKPADADAHFLLGWHLGFLGHRNAAARELRSAIDLGFRGDSPADRDEVAQRLLTHFAQRPIAQPPNAALPQSAAPNRALSGPREF